MVNPKDISLVPFYSQRIESRTAKANGFSSEDEAEYWSKRGCGIACLRMVIDGLGASSLSSFKSKSQGEMIRRGLSIEAFCQRGWIHQGLIALASEYGIKGQCFRGSSIRDLVRELNRNHLLIVSITVCFEGGMTDENGNVLAPGGHLALVYDYSQTNDEVNGFWVNHPSASIENNWERRFIELSRFAPSFSGAFMSFWI
jgi:hypothetical protein